LFTCLPNSLHANYKIAWAKKNTKKQIQNKTKCETLQLGSFRK
jgi:hypothetical protein